MKEFKEICKIKNIAFGQIKGTVVECGRSEKEEYEYVTEVNMKDVLYLKDLDSGKEFRLSCVIKPCPSEYTLSEYGIIEEYVDGKVDYENEIKDVDVESFKSDKYFDDFDSFKIKKGDLEVIIFSEFGGDEYYPNGFIKINYNELIQIEKEGAFELVDLKNNRKIVYLVYGDSNLGKSTIFNKSNYSVYEVDLLERGGIDITEMIKEYDVIVFNPKRNSVYYNGDDVEDYEIIDVEFSLKEHKKKKFVK